MLNHQIDTQSITNAMYITRKYKLYILPAMNLQVLVTNNKKYFQVEQNARQYLSVTAAVLVCLFVCFSVTYVSVYV